MRSPADAARDAPRFQQAGIELLLHLLREAHEPVHIVGQGSARPIALAYNREPELLREKVARIHLCLGSSDLAFLEWNVALDPHAAHRILTSGLPIHLYPCATADGPFSLGSHNTYWHLASMTWVNDVHPRLKRYLDFAYSRANRVDYLHAMDKDAPPGSNAERYAQGHHLWTTAMWMEISGRRLARTPGQPFRLLAPEHLPANAEVLEHHLRPCTLEVTDDGRFKFQPQPGPSLTRIYERDRPELQVQALNQALPELYCSLDPDRPRDP